MPTKIQVYSQMADHVATQITGSYQGWTEFLQTTARLYKYPYNEQLMIYAQRTDEIGGDDLPQQIADTAGKLADEYWHDHQYEILHIVDDSFSKDMMSSTSECNSGARRQSASLTRSCPAAGWSRNRFSTMRTSWRFSTSIHWPPLLPSARNTRKSRKGV